MSPDLANIAFDPIDATTLWATVGNQPVRSADFGETWLDWGVPPATPLAGFLADPATPTTSAWALGGTGSGAGAWRTTDAGLHWTRVLDAPDPRAIAPSPTDPQRVLVGASGGAALTTDGGSTWQWVRTDVAVNRIRWRGDGLRVSGLRPDRRLMRSSDGGVTWVDGTSSITGDWPEWPWVDFAYLETGPNELLAAAGETCRQPSSAYGASSLLKRSTDDGDSWSAQPITDCLPLFQPTSVSRPGVEVRAERAWAWNPYLASNPSALQASTDDGSTWHALLGSVHETPTSWFDVGVGGSLWCLQPDGDTGASTDGGGSWIVGTAGRRGLALAASDRQAGHAVRMTKQEVTDVNYLTLERTTNSGASWSQYTYWPISVSETFIAYRWGSGQTIYVWVWTWGEAHSDLLRSTDGGTTFHLHAESVPTPVDVEIAGSDFHLWAVHAAAPRSRTSTDGGLTWLATDRGLPARRPVRLLVDPRDKFAHALVVFETGEPYETWNRGARWQSMSASGVSPSKNPDPRPLPESADLRGVRITGGDWDLGIPDRRIFLATDRGLWVSDLGFVTDGLPFLDLDGVAYSRVLQRVFVWNERHGVYARDWPALPSSDPARESATSTRPGDALSLRVTPNPFHTDTELRCLLPEAGRARIEIFDTSGRRVATLLDGPVAAGERSLRWSGRNDRGQRVAAGVYFARLNAAGFTRSERVIRVD
ncbi:MAG: FlgD immunoglobulin-like domain containing protein [bacterium]